MKPKKKNAFNSKPSIIEYVLTLTVAIGLILMLILACVATVSVVNHRISTEEQTATAAAMWEYELTSYATVYYPYSSLLEAQTATQVQIQHLIEATQTAEAP